MLTTDEVIWAFRACLGRDPTPAEVDRDRSHSTFAELTDHLAQIKRLSYPSPEDRFLERAIVFVHIQKTAGTTINEALVDSIGHLNLCPIRFNELHHYSPSELSRYNFFSGHFDMASLKLIPRKSIFVFSFFRKPLNRIVSFYRFARAHPVDSVAMIDPAFRLAKTLPISSYVTHPDIVASDAINNHYLRVLTAKLYERFEFPVTAAQEKKQLKKAASRLRALHAVGISEDFDRSILLISKLLGFAIKVGARKNYTNELHLVDNTFSFAEPVDVTDELIRNGKTTHVFR